MLRAAAARRRGGRPALTIPWGRQTVDPTAFQRMQGHKSARCWGFKSQALQGDSVGEQQTLKALFEVRRHSRPMPRRIGQQALGVVEHLARQLRRGRELLALLLFLRELLVERSRSDVYAAGDR